MTIPNSSPAGQQYWPSANASKNAAPFTPAASPASTVRPWLKGRQGLNDQKLNDLRLNDQKLNDQSLCQFFQSPAHISCLTNSQIAALDLAFSEANIGQNVTIMEDRNSSDRLRETAGWLNGKLGGDCPTGLQIDILRLISADCDQTIYHSQNQPVKATIAFPVKAESLSYIDRGAISCLHIDVKLESGKIARIDILNAVHALEQEYADRVRDNCMAAFGTPFVQ